MVPKDIHKDYFQSDTIGVRIDIEETIQPKKIHNKKEQKRMR